MPGPASYYIKPMTPWGGDSINDGPSLMPREIRRTPADMAGFLNLKKERSTPSPMYYSPKMKIVEPSPAGGFIGMKM